MNVSGISTVLGRINAIESMLPGAEAETTTATPSLAGFDPFGEVYQQAVAARSFAPTAPAATGSMVGSAFSARSPVAAGAGATDAQTAAAIAGVAGTPGVRPVGGYGSMPVPPELAPFGNGKIPSNALAPVNQAGSNHRLHAPAAASWNNLVEAARADGFELRITDSYRSYEQQVDLANRKGLYSQGGYAATPGKSNHGWGLAVDADVRDPAMQQWLQVNGPRFGWVESVPREPWHWEFRPNQV